ncbi:MAG: hypothetical protein AAGD35_07235 [Actinomycetota bacterium]
MSDFVGIHYDLAAPSASRFRELERQIGENIAGKAGNAMSIAQLGAGEDSALAALGAECGSIAGEIETAMTEMAAIRWDSIISPSPGYLPNIGPVQQPIPVVPHNGVVPDPDRLSSSPVGAAHYLLPLFGSTNPNDPGVRGWTNSNYLQYLVDKKVIGEGFRLNFNNGIEYSVDANGDASLSYFGGKRLDAVIGDSLKVDGIGAFSSKGTYDPWFRTPAGWHWLLPHDVEHYQVWKGEQERLEEGFESFVPESVGDWLLGTFVNLFPGTGTALLISSYGPPETWGLTLKKGAAVNLKGRIDAPAFLTRIAGKLPGNEAMGAIVLAMIDQLGSGQAKYGTDAFVDLSGDFGDVTGRPVSLKGGVAISGSYLAQLGFPTSILAGIGLPVDDMGVLYGNGGQVVASIGEISNRALLVDNAFTNYGLDLAVTQLEWKVSTTQYRIPDGGIAIPGVHDGVPGFYYKTKSGRLEFKPEIGLTYLNHQWEKMVIERTTVEDPGHRNVPLQIVLGNARLNGLEGYAGLLPGGGVDGALAELAREALADLVAAETGSPLTDEQWEALYTASFNQPVVHSGWLPREEWVKDGIEGLAEPGGPLEGVDRNELVAIYEEHLANIRETAVQLSWRGGMYTIRQQFAEQKIAEMTPEEITNLYLEAGLTPPGTTIKVFTGTEGVTRVAPQFGAGANPADENIGVEVSLASNSYDLQQTGEIRLTPDGDAALIALGRSDPEAATQVVAFLADLYSNGEIPTVDAEMIEQLAEEAYLPSSEPIDLDIQSMAPVSTGNI